MNKMILVLAVLFGVNSLMAQDVPYKVNVRLDLLPEVKLFAGNMTLSTLIGTGLIFAGMTLEELATLTMSRRVAPVISVPANAITWAGGFTIGLAFIYNSLKLAEYWRKSAHAEFKKLGTSGDGDAITITL